MTKDALYSVWAPRGGVWTPWAKGVVFAHFHGVEVDETNLPEMNLSWLPQQAGWAIVIDLPGALGVEMALRLAREGFRPVPLYNAVPAPLSIAETVPVREIVRALAGAANEIFRLGIALNAPPVFMLDSLRRVGTGSSSPGDFDNRSICFPTDFPSAAFLTANGIANVLLIREEMNSPQSDLAHTLLRWQQAGIQIASRPLQGEGLPEPIRIARPSGFQFLWYRLLAVFRLRHNLLGGYGGKVPFPSEYGSAG